MKVDTSKLKKGGSSELTPECRQLIDDITKCRTRAEILKFLETVQVWVFGKCELYHWIEILDRFDKVLEEAARHVNGNEFILHCDTSFTDEDFRLLMLVLNFTTLLIEHSFSRHLYNSIEHLTELLSSQNMDIVLAVLNLLYMFSKRSNFIPRLSFEKKEMLLIKLFNIAERWGDPNYGLALIDCCMKKPKLEFLYQFLVEYVDENGHAALLEIPDMLELCKRSAPADVVRILCKQMYNPSDAIKMRIAHRVRLVSGFRNYRLRLQFVQARLQAVSVLIYSNALQENIDRVLYSGFGEELCELIDKEDTDLVEIRAAVLRTLTSMLHFDRNPNVPRAGSRLPKIIQYTGAERQSGILPLLVRDCIASLTGNGPSDKYPLILATSLFSLLYHLASYEAGGHALLKSGMMRSLLQVISWPGVELEHITFVTRAVRVIDLITNIDIAKFHQNNGLNVFIDRLEKEINCCRNAIAEQVIAEGGSNNVQGTDHTIVDRGGIIADDVMRQSSEGGETQSERRNSTDSDVILLENSNVNSENTEDISGIEHEERNINVSAENNDRPVVYPPNSYYAVPLLERNAKAAAAAASAQQKKLACVTQRAALLKSMLNFLKKSIHDHSHFNGMRNIMETSLPCSLRHIISNAEFYGPSLFLLATDVVTVYVFNEPSLLSSLQDSGLTSTILQSLLHKDVPATREVLGSLPNVFSALCLNERGLMEFMSYVPFDKLLKVLLSPDYLVAMRRRRSSDPLGDTATNLGNAMDDLMKHHPYLRTDATEAIVRLLNELVRLGSDPAFICWRANKDSGSNSNGNNGSNGSSVNVQNLNNANAGDPGSNENENNDSSGEDDDDDDEMSSASQQQRQNRQPVTSPQQIQTRENPQEREAIPLIDYILNVMKFIEAIFSNSSNGEHCREFVLHGGLKPLLQLLSLPNLPVDSPVSTTAQAVANVCKSILNLAHETKVINTALQQLSQIVANLKPLIKHFSFPGCSILLQELLSCPKLDDGFSIADYTPLLHSMSSVHGYVVMLVHLCRNASNEMRMTLLKRWGSNSTTGLQLLQNLVQLYISLVWESTILLGMCSDEPYAQNCELSWDEMFSVDHLETAKEKTEDSDENSAEGSVRMLERSNPPKVKLKPEDQLRYIKSLLAASSRLGRALAELFGTLVKLSVGSPQSRQRRNNDYVGAFFGAKFPNSDAKDIARVLSSILVNGFNHEDILPKPAPKLKLTFLICSVGFTGPMLFDDKRSSFHLMISQFCAENGLKAFFDMFYWTISLGGKKSKFSFDSCMKMENVLEDCEEDSRPFPEGTGEFLDAWLQLLEKMVNPRAILDSPYSIAPRAQNNISEPTVHFEPIFYLTQMHQLALQAIRRIWKRKPISNYGLSMTETIMTILKHLIKSHTMLNDRFKTRLSELQNASKNEQSKTSTQPDEANVNSDHVKTLTDMGFPRFHVIEALQNTRSLEQATDYLLSHTAAQTRENADSAAGDFSQPVGNEMDIDADASTSASEHGPSTSKTDYKVNFEEMKLIATEVFNEFCNQSLERTFEFMEHLPETVNAGAELIAVLYRRNNQMEKHKFIINLVKNVTDYGDIILQRLKEPSKTPQEVEELMNGSLAAKLFIRLKVSTLLLDETYMDIRKEFCVSISPYVLNLLLMLLQQTEEFLNESGMKEKNPAPRWLRNLLEFIDAVDNVSVILQRKANMRAVCSDNWKWYDTSTGKWNSYSESNNTSIKNAFNMGERSVVINIGRQRYTINFNCMTQVSEASGNHRSVLPSLKITDAVHALLNGNTNNKVETIVTRIIKGRGEDNKLIQQDDVIKLQSLLKQQDDKKETPKDAETAPSDDQQKNLETNRNNVPLLPTDANNLSTQTEEMTSPNFKKVKTKGYVKSIKKPINSPPNVVQKIIIHDETVGVAKFDTKKLIDCLVRMLQPKVTINFETKLAILKMCARLTKDYENSKAFVFNGGIQLLLNMRQSCGMMGFPTYAIIIIRHVLEAPPVLQEAIERIISLRASPSVAVGHRDLIFVLTQVSSAVARQPSTFLNAAKQTLRAEYISTPAMSGDDSRILVKTQIPNKKSPGNNQPPSKSVEEDMAQCQTSLDVIKMLLHAIVQPCVHYGGITTENADLFQDTVETTEVSPSKGPAQKKSNEKFEPCCCSWHIPSSGHTHQKPILPRSTLIKTLADSVRSYQSLVPKAIIEHIYNPSDSVLIEKEQSCLSFILDNFLPLVKRQQDAEVSMMSRVLIASLADCYGHSQIQTKVIEELHEAIVRVLAQSDSAEKHTRLQVLIGLLPAMIESPMLSNKMHVQRNNMYRIMLRQGIMNDLVKISQYKDLSNPHTLSTIYSVLRPMEILLRLTVAPGSLSSKRIFFGTPSPGATSIINRRHFPRLSRTIPSLSSNAIGDEYREYVLRDIIRNVLSDRRHVFDFFFNADDIFVDSEDATPAASSNPEDEIDDSEPDANPSISTNERAQLHFDRLWDDLLQNENLRLIQRNTSGSGNNGTANNSNSDHHRLHNNEDQAQSNENEAGGGSDGASTSSETAAAVATNAQSLLGDVSTSESDSDSNVSTENDERNADEDEEEEDEDDGNDEGMEDRSETDADDETRQFIEVFDHMYEPESSETASNDADADADDEASEVGGGVVPDDSHPSIPQLGVSESNSLETHLLSEEEQQEHRAAVANSHERAAETPAETSNSSNTTLPQAFIGTGSDAVSNATSGTVRTTAPRISWGTPRVAVVGTGGNLIYRPSTYAEAASFEARNENNESNHVNPVTTNSQFPLPNHQRREQTRRLVFLDQQYCAPMPSFGNPTEEGQIEVFNQDALHWWLEEAKYLDLESQTDACLYVAHFLVPFLIKELKLTCVQKNLPEAAKESSNLESTTSSANRRSAIPVLIPHSTTPMQGNVNIATSSNVTINEANASINTTSISEESSNAMVPQVVLHGEVSLYGVQQENRTLPSENRNNDDNDAGIEGGEDDEEDDNYTGEEDDGDDADDAEDPDEQDDADDELNTAFMRDEELNSNFNIELANALRLATTTQENAAHSVRTTRDQSANPETGSDDAENMSMADDNLQIQLNAVEENEAIEGIQQTSNDIRPVHLEHNGAFPTSDGAANSESSTNTTSNGTTPRTASSDVPDMSPEVRAALGDLEVPEGVDPSFLAALPREMREEVIQEHLRMQRVRLRAQQNAIQVAHESLLEVNPEFLAALPPNIQSEVLMQQRIEQQRQAAQTANPDDPVDTAAFFQNLPESLRQAILTDMEESQIASLPPDLAAEAQFLRRDWESRNGARLEASQTHALDGYLTARLSSIQNLGEESRWHTNSIWYDANGMPQPQHHQHTTIVHQQHLHGKPIALLLMEDENNMLDTDGLASLLLFLFIDDQKINYTRLHRVVRNLCYHLPTREWIINALISIIQKTNEVKVQCSDYRSIKPKWLKLKVDAAFGYKSNIFIINEANPSFNGTGTFSSPEYTIQINPQAAQMIVRNCLELLFVLAKHFSSSFVPYNRDIKDKIKSTQLPKQPSSSVDNTTNVPMAVTITAGPVSVGDIEMSPEQLRAIIQRHQSSSTQPNTRRTIGHHADGRGFSGIDTKLDDYPSTSKAAAVRNQQKCLANNRNRFVKGLQYNTNENNFWNVLLNIDMHTQKRMANIKSFPINSHPPWEWEERSSDFLSFNDSSFARLLEMLPYKVICRSPQLTDMLVKLLASLSNELPREDDTIEQKIEESAKVQSSVANIQPTSSGTNVNAEISAECAQAQSETNTVDQTREDSKSVEQTPPTTQTTTSKIKRKMYSKNFLQLQIVIQVLTHQCGTTEGLDNVSKLIVNLSQCSQASNAIFLQYLSAAIMGLAEEVREAIQSLLDEIRVYNAWNANKASTSSTSLQIAPGSALHKGTMQDRFTAENVIISAPANVRPCELQLPAMKKLLSSSSAQPYFLRTLKIFIQVRELFEAQDNVSGTSISTSKPTLSQIICLDNLWNTLSDCLVALEESKDEYAVLVLQPAVEAFFLIHASQKKEKTNQRSGRTSTPSTNSQVNNPVGEEDTNSNNSPTTTESISSNQNHEASRSNNSTSSPLSNSTNKMEVSTCLSENQLKLDRLKFLSFAEKHRTVLNQILRQSPMHLSDGPFAVLVDHTRILDFDVKRKYFQTELERLDEGVRREENTVSVRRVTVFEDSFRVLYRLGPEEWKNRFYIVFEDEEGQDAGGLLREWYVIISREIFNPMYALFCVSPGDRVTYMINPSSHANPNHLSYFKFVGRVIAKAVHDNKLLECYFTRSFYKHILGKQVKYTDMESQDYEFYKGLDYLMKNDISTLGYELTFSTEVQEFGVTQVRDLIPNGRNIPVTEENKFEYVQLVCQLKMSGSIRQQLDAFLEGFYDIIPKHLISIFNEQELELLISGLPDIDIEDLKANAEYHKYTSKSVQIQWFWRALRSFDQADRAKFLQFVTGTSKVPLQGFGSLEGMNGIQKFQIHRDDRSTDRLPCAHTCFNQLDLPMYKSYEKLRSCLLKAIHECSEGFGFA